MHDHHSQLVTEAILQHGDTSHLVLRCCWLIGEAVNLFEAGCHCAFHFLHLNRDGKPANPVNTRSYSSADFHGRRGVLHKLQDADNARHEVKHRAHPRRLASHHFIEIKPTDNNTRKLLS